MPGENHSVEARASRTEGLGLFALNRFSAGERIRRVALVREVTDDAPLRKDLGERIEHCAHPDGKVVLYDYPDRHMNHSCNPNAYEDYCEGYPVFRAIRDIGIDEELTVDYLINNGGGNSWPCNCGSQRCRGHTGTSFFELPTQFQTEYLPYLAPWFQKRYRSQLQLLVGDL